MNSVAKSNRPQITPDHIATRTKQELGFSAMASGFLTIMAAAVLTTGQFDKAILPVALVACTISLVAVFRNRLRRIFRRRRFDLYYKWRSRLIGPFVMISGLFVGFLFGAPQLLERAEFGPIMAIGFVLIALLLAIGGALSEKGEASLLFEQCAYEIRVGTRYLQAFFWLDWGLYALMRILRRHGISLHMPTLRLGARLYTEKREDTKVLNDLSLALLHIENSGQLTSLRSSIEAFYAIGKDAMSKGMSPQPRLIDYFDYRYLSLKNLQYIVVILSSLVGVAIVVSTWILHG